MRLAHTSGQMEEARDISIYTYIYGSNVLTTHIILKHQGLSTCHSVWLPPKHVSAAAPLPSARKLHCITERGTQSVLITNALTASDSLSSMMNAATGKIKPNAFAVFQANDVSQGLTSQLQEGVPLSVVWGDATFIKMRRTTRGGNSLQRPRTWSRCSPVLVWHGKYFERRHKSGWPPACHVTLSGIPPPKLGGHIPVT